MTVNLNFRRLSHARDLLPSCDPSLNPLLIPEVPCVIQTVLPELSQYSLFLFIEGVTQKLPVSYKKIRARIAWLHYSELAPSKSFQRKLRVDRKGKNGFQLERTTSERSWGGEQANCERNRDDRIGESFPHL